MENINYREPTVEEYIHGTYEFINGIYGEFKSNKMYCPKVHDSWKKYIAFNELKYLTQYIEDIRDGMSEDMATYILIKSVDDARHEVEKNIKEKEGRVEPIQQDKIMIVTNSSRIFNSNLSIDDGDADAEVEFTYIASLK